MDVQEILAKARVSSECPSDWVVFPLLRNKVLTGIFGWLLGIILSAGLLALVAPIVIPSNYEHGMAAIIFTTLLLGVFLFVLVGTAFLLIADIKRFLHPDKHIIVLTTDDFVKQEGEKITQVPMISIRHVTSRGKTPPSSTPEVVEQLNTRQSATKAVGAIGRALVPGSRSRRMRSPTSLAFIDIRTNQEVTVVNDNSYGDPFFIADMLKEYSAATEQ